jgi:hypothetical protein
MTSTTLTLHFGSGEIDSSISCQNIGATRGAYLSGADFRYVFNPGDTVQWVLGDGWPEGTKLIGLTSVDPKAKSDLCFDDGSLVSEAAVAQSYHKRNEEESLMVTVATDATDPDVKYLIWGSSPGANGDTVSWYFEPESIIPGFPESDPPPSDPPPAGDPPSSDG